MNGKTIPEKTKEHDGKFQIIIYVSDIDDNWSGHTKHIILNLTSTPIPTPPNTHNYGLSTLAWFGIILGSGLFLVGVPYCFYVFVIRRRIRKKRWEKFNNIGKDNDKNKESESE